MKRIWIVGAVVVAAGALGLWVYRTQQVVLGATDAQLLTLLGSQARLVGPGLPWDAPDVVLSWKDAWSRPGLPLVEPVSGPAPKGVVAYDALGILGPRGATVSSWKDWEAGVQPSARLAVAGRSDAELLTTFLWFADMTLGPETLGTTFETVSTDPSAVAPSGVFQEGHPWLAVVKELRQWQQSGRLVAQWWDYGAEDVVRAVTEGRAKWGLSWSSQHRASAVDGVPQTSLSPLPVQPGRRSGTVIGRWVLGASGTGWGPGPRSAEILAGFQNQETGQFWLKSQGLLLTNTDLPAVDQESKEFALALPRAGFAIAAPRGDELGRWSAFIAALRSALRS